MFHLKGSNFTLFPIFQTLTAEEANYSAENNEFDMRGPRGEQGTRTWSPRAHSLRVLSETLSRSHTREMEKCMTINERHLLCIFCIKKY